MDLTTTYLGLRLRNPLVASASPLSSTLDGIHRLHDAGVGAIIMYSLFEEQLRQRALRRSELLDEPADSFSEALNYFPATAYEDPGPRDYLSLLERAAATTPVPVIASLNGVTPGSWAEYARQMLDAGAAAIELNMYGVPGDPRISGTQLEQRHIEVLQRVKDAVTVPVAVKLSPFYSSLAEMAQLLDKAEPTRWCSSTDSCNQISTLKSSSWCPESPFPANWKTASADVHRIAAWPGTCRTRRNLRRGNP
jgi:dihydroorotate dehydrogenase (fumarate)